MRFQTKGLCVTATGCVCVCVCVCTITKALCFADFACKLEDKPCAQLKADSRR
jgi:hypothetical protein